LIAREARVLVDIQESVAPGKSNDIGDLNVESCLGLEIPDQLEGSSKDLTRGQAAQKKEVIDSHRQEKRYLKGSWNGVVSLPNFSTR
jgi:hypothetical protein